MTPLGLGGLGCGWWLVTPEVPIHLVPPLGGLLSTRGGHGKGLQPCFTIREDFTERRAYYLDAAPGAAVDAGAS